MKYAIPALLICSMFAGFLKLNSVEREVDTYSSSLQEVNETLDALDKRVQQNEQAVRSLSDSINKLAESLNK